jgi:surface carbohydrate biosynthesis protein
MFSRFKRLWDHLCYFLQAKKVWAWPQQSKVLIYDAANREILLEYLKPWQPEILHVRGEQVNMWVFLKCLFRGRGNVNAYIDCFIETVNPHLVVTIVDNKSTFYTISQRHPDLKTLFIQNGLRGYYCDIFAELDRLDSDALSAFFVDYMLVLGSVYGNHYRRYVKGKIITAGSIKNNFVRKEKLPQPGVIAFVSQWRLSPGIDLGYTFCSFNDFWVKPDTLVLQCLMSYASKNNKKLMIIPSQRNDSDVPISEKDYFRKVMGGEPEFLEPSGSCSGYHAVDLADIVVALESTLAFEAIARGKKAAIFPIRGTMLSVTGWDYGWPGVFSDEGPFWTNKPEPDIFVRILDYLFAVTDEQWQEDLTSTNFSSIMEYDPENTMLQSILEKEIGPPPVSAS